jgi:tRNA 2-thiouridine synthesizing protein B
MLHTVNKSPFEKNSLDTCLRLAKAGSDILLIEDGVYAALSGSVMENKVKGAIGQHIVYALGPDLAARGISEDKLIDGIKVVGYDGFVELAAKNDRVQSWL